VEIRRARPSDVAAIEAVVGHGYAVYVERIGRRPAPMDDDYAAKIRGGEVFVAEVEGEVAGLIVLIAAPDHLLVENVAVEPQSQRHGLGGALMAFAEETARRLGTRELRLYTNVAMTENIDFYRHLGYTEDGRRTEDGFARVYFSKRLP
jgi:ribosomal protein S18 acetylase RimI-like enzyme